MIYTAVDDFYLSAEELESSPSRRDGVAAALEAQLRRYGCDVIAEAAVLLSLPQGVACTAQVLLHRFYCKRSLAKFDVKVMAMAMFWLAAKLEEVVEIDSPSKLKLRDVMSVIYRVVRRREGKSLQPLDPFSRVSLCAFIFIGARWREELPSPISFPVGPIVHIHPFFFFN